MKIRHNRRGRAGLSAALMTRDVACGMYPPGSDGWNRWGCGASAPPPPPAPPPAQMYTPAPPPVQYAVPPPKEAPAPPPANIDYDAEYARRVQAAENAQISAQLLAEEQSRTAAEQAAKAAEAQRKLESIQAANAASMSALDAGNAGYGFSTSSETQEQSNASSESNNGILLAVLAGIGALFLFGRKSSKR